MAGPTDPRTPSAHTTLNGIRPLNGKKGKELRPASVGDGNIGVRRGVSKEMENRCRPPALRAGHPCRRATPETSIGPFQGSSPAGRKRVGHGRPG
jgi:hypothetical protein